MSIPTVLAGQSRSILGSAFDSLRNRPLDGAEITVIGAASRTKTDANGKFAIQNLPAGRYQVVLTHAAVEAIGVSGLTAWVDIRERTIDTVHLSVPPFTHFWTIACSRRVPGPDTSLVYGSINRIGGVLSSRAVQVRALWNSVIQDSAGRPSIRAWQLTADADSAGNYALCGVPAETDVTVIVASKQVSWGPYALETASERVVRQDFSVAEGGTPSGALTGLVRTDGAVPIAGSRVLIEPGEFETRTAADGGFMLRGLPPGTKTLRVFAIGFVPFVKLITVFPRDTTTAFADLTRAAQLGPVSVTARRVRDEVRLERQERRHAALGHFLDSTQIGGAATTLEALSAVSDVKRICAVFIDGVSSTVGELASRSPHDYEEIEVHSGTDVSLPLRFRVEHCDQPLRLIVLAWTKDS